MITLCSPGYLVGTKLAGEERKFLLDSLLFPRIVIDPLTAFSFFTLHEDLAKESVEIWVRKGCHSAVDEIDESYAEMYIAVANSSWEPCTSRDTEVKRFLCKAPDVATAYLMMSPFTRFRVTSLLQVKHPTVVLERVRDFYSRTRHSCFEEPIAKGDLQSLLLTIDRNAEDILMKTADRFARMALPENDALSAGSSVRALALAKLFSRHGYAYMESLPDEFFKGYLSVFEKLASLISNEDFRLFAQLRKASVADQTLAYLLEEGIGGLSTLVGFVPLDPMKLLENLPDPTEDLEKAIEARREVDKNIIRIRQKTDSFRNLVEKIHSKCMEGSLEYATDAKKSLMDSAPSESINRIMFDHLSQFSNQSTITQLESRLNTEIGRKDMITWFGGYFGDVRLMISGLLLAARHLGLNDEFNKILDAVAVGLLAPALVARIFRSIMSSLPGFDIYAAFHKWPRDSQSSSRTNPD